MSAGGSCGAKVRGTLGEQVAWLLALRALNLPLDAFHLGACGLNNAPMSSPMATHNLAAVMRGVWPPRRWHLVVLVRRIAAVPGELAAVVADPTGEALATFDPEVSKHWPHAMVEGSALLLTNIVALPPIRPPQGGAALPAAAHLEKPRLLVLPRTLGRCFAAGDAPPEQAAALLSEARACLAGG